MSASSMAPWEVAWLDWAHDVVRIKDDKPMHYAWCQARLARCTATRGPGAYAHDVEADPASDPALRWPGYVGAGWRPGAGVLFIGSVHADFTRLGGGAGDASRISTVRDLATANRAYVGAKIGDQAARRRFLDVSRQAYTELAPGWTRAGVLHDLLEIVMPNEEPRARFEGAAWTNLAHCRARPRKTVGGEYLLQQKCSGSNGAFPLEVLVGILWPAAIIISVSPFQGSRARHYNVLPLEPRVERPSGVANPLVVAFNGSSRPSGGLWGGRLSEEWLPEVAAEIRQRMKIHG